MLKRDITYEDFDGDEQTDTLYFNLSKSELLELEVGYEGGAEKFLTQLARGQDRKALFDEFKKYILLAYGKKSEDGKRFEKSQELRDEFVQTAAYDALFIELTSNENSAAEFINGIMPKKLVEDIQKAEQAAADQVKAKQNVFEGNEPKRELSLPPQPPQR